MRLISALKLFGLITLLGGVFYNFRSDSMAKIHFDLGKNIHEVAKHSGAPKFITRNVAGLISYKIVDLPDDIPAILQRPDYEIVALPLFAFTLYADIENDNGLSVETASLQFSADQLKTHETAKAFVENMIAQFHKGRWERFIPDLCPSVTGRSSFLDETGRLDETSSCPLDPHYRLSMDDWISMIGRTQDYQWLGGGILATLTVGFSNDVRGLTYSVQLDYDDFAIKNRRDKQRTLQIFAEGDAAGQNTTTKRAKERVEAQLRIKKWKKKR